MTNLITSPALADWLCSSIFPNASAIDQGNPGGEVGQHLPGHRFETLIAGACLQCLTQYAQVCLAGGCDGKHQMAQHLLRDVEYIKGLLVHVENLLSENS